MLYTTQTSYKYPIKLMSQGLIVIGYIYIYIYLFIYLSRLELPFEEMEVLEVVKGMNRDKSLGPDGFSMAFLQDC
jgi:hypothetical protein